MHKNAWIGQNSGEILAKIQRACKAAVGRNHVTIVSETQEGFSKLQIVWPFV